MNILAIDPGTAKCGIAVIDEGAVLLRHEIVETKNLIPRLMILADEFRVTALALGNATFSGQIKDSIEKNMPGAALVMVNEKNSTETGKLLYFKHNPPKGIWRFIPLGLQSPKVPYDDYAALAIGMEYLKNCRGEQRSPDGGMR